MLPEGMQGILPGMPRPPGSPQEEGRAGKDCQGGIAQKRVCGPDDRCFATRRRGGKSELGRAPCRVTPWHPSGMTIRATETSRRHVFQLENVTSGETSNLPGEQSQVGEEGLLGPPILPGSELDPISNGRARGMVVTPAREHRIRLTGPQGFRYYPPWKSIPWTSRRR